MGAAFKVRRFRLDRVVALKLLSPSLARLSASAGRFNREARVPAPLNHPGIVSVYDHGDAPLMTALNHLRHNVATFQPGVLAAHLRRVIEQTDVGLRVADDGLRAGLDKRIDVAVGVELGQELLIPIRDVHVNHRAAPGRRAGRWCEGGTPDDRRRPSFRLEVEGSASFQGGGRDGVPLVADPPDVARVFEPVAVAGRKSITPRIARPKGAGSIR